LIYQSIKFAARRLRCQTEEDAKVLRELNCEAATKGLQARKPKYGIVAHKLDKNDYEALMKASEDTIKHMQDGNDLTIANIAPPLRKDDNNSIIIFTFDPHAADRCIKQGIYINYCLYTAQKYTPEPLTTQCYNCGEYGHREAQCQNNDAENAERITTEHANANTQANRSAATAMAIMKTGITNALHEPPSAAG
jgi:hypothetical protein